MTTKLTNEQARNLIRAIVSATSGAALTTDGDGSPSGYKLSAEREVWMRYDSWKHRVTIHGSWPRSRISGETHTQFGPWDLHPRPDETSITVSADKPAAKIATEISRRFMPAYEAVLARCLERREGHEKYMNTQTCVTSDIAAALGQTPNGTHFHLSSTERGFYGSVDVSGDTVKVEVRSLGAAQALKLIELLKTL